MIEWLADKLGIVSMAPFIRPAMALVLSLASAVLVLIASDKPWAWALLGLATVFATYSFVQSVAIGTTAGLCASLLGFYLSTGLDTSMTALRATHLGCVVVEKHSPLDCVGAAEDHALSRSGRARPE